VLVVNLDELITYFIMGLRSVEKEIGLEGPL